MSKKPTKVAALFAGIAGVEVGLRRSGFKTNLFCEIDEGAVAVLAEHFPRVPLVRDVRELDRLPEDTDLLTAGFPCQDLSQAGGTKGLSGKNSGLIGEVFRLLRNQEVPWLLLENVPFMLQLAGGHAVRCIVDELENLGYRWAYRVVDSRAFGLPQRRERVFLLASKAANPWDVLFRDDAVPAAEPNGNFHGKACGFYWTEGTRGLGWAVNAIPTLKGGSTIGIPSPPAIWLPDGRIVKPDIRDGERLQGFQADWTKPVESVARPGHRWKLVGNAVTVDTAEWIGRSLAAKATKAEFRAGELRPKAPWPKAAFGAPGQGAQEALVSTWPEHNRCPDLATFLLYEAKPLSHKATSGFVRRLKASCLWYPPEFMAALEAHEAAVRD